MSREAPHSWYYRDVPTWIIAASVAAATITFFAVEFRPVRTAPPVTVVAHQDAPPPWKAIIPDRLPSPLLPYIQPPPVVPPPEVRAWRAHSALDDILSQNLSVPPQPPSQPSPSPLALRYSVLKQLPDGSFAPAAPPRELAGNDRAAIRFESADSGFLTVFEQSPGGWQKTFSSQIPSSSAYTFAPRSTLLSETGSRQFLILFSREFQSPEPSELDNLSPVNREDFPQPGFIVRATPQNPELLAFTLTLSYSP